MKKLIAGCFAILFMYGVPQAWGHEHTSGMSMTEPQTGSIYNLKDTWTTSEGKNFQLTELAGRPVVMSMIYTSCKEVCPRIVEDMKKIERTLPPELVGRVQFAVFSFDTQRDTIDKLKEYAKAHHIDTPTWLIARSDAGAIRRLSIALGMKYKKLRDGDFEHDTLISVVDQYGVISYRVNNFTHETDETISAIKKMMKQ
ncbi:protein SCO1/2 [Novimethylophilus kurashikiensis]|uniref:Protein SCO1/2 n=1 Tax=Novimethylophilus kurashikiensis TaxID=1825523 RepID=A0A2R5FA57_9PROT|nr:SCO family protein [Novimethylophilus kurashikiensis]GBG14915.1 protein SCO1/2 [Novimethylophilus kurashikiensis]